MKKYLLLFTLILLTSLVTGFSGNKINEYLKSNTDCFVGLDTIPKNTKLKDAQKAKDGLLKKITKILSFKKNSQKKKKALILQTLNELHLDDTITASSLRVKLYIDSIATKQENQYDQLSKLIDKLIIVAGNKSSPEHLSSAGRNKEPVLIPESKDQMPDINSAIDSAAVPELALADDNKDKLEKLSLIKLIAASKKNEITRSDEKSGVVYRFRINKKIEILGFYNPRYRVNPKGINFHFLNGMVCDSVFTVTQYGNLNKLRAWPGDEIISAAKNGSCQVIYTLNWDNKMSIGSFLSNAGAVENFVKNVLELQKLDKADGINIKFSTLSTVDREIFKEFLSYIHDLIKKNLPQFKIYLTIPPFDSKRLYNIQEISPFVDKFCIDFSTNSQRSSAPLAPLLGKQQSSMSTSISYYLNQQVEPGKFFINFSYRGTKWAFHPYTKKHDTFIQYLTYNSIRNKAFSKVLYDKESNSAFIDSIDVTGKIITRIWFDDENTLSAKYDFVLQNGLGGIGFSYLGNDGLYGELSDLLLYKFIRVDTLTNLKSTNPKLSVFQKLSERLSLYDYILQNPCERCFSNYTAINDPAKDSLMNYVADLKIDSLTASYNTEIYKYNQYKDEKYELQPLTVFLYLTKEVNTIFLFAAIFFLLVLILLVMVYVRYVRLKPGKWRYKKHFGWLITIFSILFLWMVFNYLFTNDLVPFFGVSTDNHTEGLAVSENGTKNMPSECQIDSDCINIPLKTLQEIILLASLIGILLARLLILPLLKKEDIP